MSERRTCRVQYMTPQELSHERPKPGIDWAGIFLVALITIAGLLVVHWTLRS